MYIDLSGKSRNI